MKKTSAIIHLFIGIMFCFSFYAAQAKDKTAATLTYRSLNSTVYEVTLTYYEECTGLNPPYNMALLCNSSCHSQVVFNLDQVSNSWHEITPACAGSTYCQGGQNEGINKVIYSGTISLPCVCQDWVLSISHCCMNFYSGENVINGYGHNTYVEARINNVDGWENSSPQFISDPVFYISNNSTSVLDNSAYDPDGDSLVYSFTSPQEGANQNMSYINGLSFLHPLWEFAPITLNTQDGSITVSPDSTQTTLVCEQVSEYRNGILIGTVQRQQVLYVIADPNQQPSITGINGSNFYVDTIPALAPYCLQIFSEDEDSIDFTSLSWDSTLSNATFNVSQSQHSSVEICWTPTLVDTFFNPHCFSVNVDDNRCPYHGHRAYSFYLTVRYDAEVGTTNDEHGNFLSLTPNPTTSLLKIQTTQSIEQIELYNMLGKQVGSWQSTAGKKEIEIDLTKLSAGIYFLQASSGEKVWRGKVVKE